MKKLFCILVILFFASTVWGVDKKNVGKTMKTIHKSQQVEEKEIKATEQKAKRPMKKIDEARTNRLKR